MHDKYFLFTFATSLVNIIINPPIKAQILNVMQNYWFVYSVDTVTTSGEFESFGMILDHEELQDVVNDAIEDGLTINSVNVSMYDSNGDMLSERNVTHLFNQAQGN